ncbi:tetratricopeptide repeat protein [Parvibaculum sp.]|uniref:tetratricopeptide repeat protein n=1 Tax=Parvibaculum sp. TaxID=2024848 RepID=UPI002BF061CF|nr:tetratricopeptide repeat protein [Parvibaculum sp.]HUD51106.1 tetratricopeptide repeat protein [Parvibaculum sp.]
MMTEGIRTANSPRRSAEAVVKLTGTVLLLAGLVFWNAQAHAAGKTADTPPSEASGADMYQRGYYPEALAEWKKAVDERQDAGAAFRLGEEYFDAKVVQRDVAAALKYYEFGAEHGDARAQMDLGSLFDKGWGVPRNPVEAAKWYEAAAKQGMAEAQYNIGTMYQAGEGVTKDDRKAYMYFLLAVQNGFPQFANKELEKMSGSMSPEDIKQATIMARDFKTNVAKQDAVTR